jgi:hypothetical protein
VKLIIHVELYTGLGSVTPTAGASADPQRQQGEVAQTRDVLQSESAKNS